MIKKVEQIPPKIRVLITFASIIIIFACFIYIKDYGWKERRAAFVQSAEETLNMYGDSIDHTYITHAYVGVYVNSRKWNNTSDDTKDAFMKEVYALLHMDAINSGIFKDNTIILSFYNGDDRIAMYEIKE